MLKKLWELASLTACQNAIDKNSTEILPLDGMSKHEHTDVEFAVQQNTVKAHR